MNIEIFVKREDIFSCVSTKPETGVPLELAIDRYLKKKYKSYCNVACTEIALFIKNNIHTGMMLLHGEELISLPEKAKLWMLKWLATAYHRCKPFSFVVDIPKKYLNKNAVYFEQRRPDVIKKINRVRNK